MAAAAGGAAAAAAGGEEKKKGLCVVLVDDTYEELEFHYPRLRLIEAGYEVKVAAVSVKHNWLSKHGYWGRSDCTFEDVDAKEVAALVIPGGMCTDRLRRYEAAKQLTKDCWEAGAVVAFICHAGWLPSSAKILKGRRVTSFFAIKDDLEHAGAEWVDERVVVDGRMVTAQTPDDLPGFMKAVLELLEEKK